MANLQNSQEEIWKDIPGYEGIYQVSSLGKIKSLDRIVRKKLHASVETLYPVRYKGKLLKPFYQRDGYLLICLCDNCVLVHSMVALAFHGPKPKGWVAVMHLNNKKDDNRAINLKYGTYSQNAKQAIDDKIYIHGRLGKHGANNPLSKPVLQLDLNGHPLRQFASTVEAAKCIGVSQQGISNACINGVNKKITSGGYRWKYI